MNALTPRGIDETPSDSPGSQGIQWKGLASPFNVLARWSGDLYKMDSTSHQDHPSRYQRCSARTGQVPPPGHEAKNRGSSSNERLLSRMGVTDTSVSVICNRNFPSCPFPPLTSPLRSHFPARDHAATSVTSAVDPASLVSIVCKFSALWMSAR